MLFVCFSRRLMLCSVALLLLLLRVQPSMAQVESSVDPVMEVTLEENAEEASPTQIDILGVCNSLLETCYQEATEALVETIDPLLDATLDVISCEVVEQTELFEALCMPYCAAYIESSLWGGTTCKEACQYARQDVLFQCAVSYQHPFSEAVKFELYELIEIIECYLFGSGDSSEPTFDEPRDCSGK